jgi:predicted CoA-substrate-specific enzyme activase
MRRYVGIDVGAEAIKVVELAGEPAALRWTRRAEVEHRGQPTVALAGLLAGFDWAGVAGAAVTGRLGSQVALPRVPQKQAQSAGAGYLVGDVPITVVSIGAHGCSVLERRGGGVELFRENARCAQGTGHFLRQLVQRFGLEVEEAAALAAEVADPAPLSGRCPVILKTDMTHLANKGEGRERILAGLLDAIAESAQVLVKPRRGPTRLALAGGVARAARVRDHFDRFARRHGLSLDGWSAEDGLHLDALGAAVLAAADPRRPPPLTALFQPAPEPPLEVLPSLARSLARVRRLPEQPRPAFAGARDAVLGFDIGSTGSKAALLDVATGQLLWDGYLRTDGDPVGAAQALVKLLLQGEAGAHRVLGFGATGSGREMVGSLLSTCYCGEAVHVLNEIAAHAAGARHVDPRVDTIFEIGGQDAKYIRLDGGRVVDAAMNEACSAGTGSFIEEQGRRFHGIDSVAQLGEEALAAPQGVALGQHCSVFMAEVIDGAVARGVARGPILAGLHDSVVANYLNRVKGTRSVGSVIFCQGMPFASDALAAAVARQTGAEVIVPPRPGLQGAIGIALLAAAELPLAGRAPAALPTFLGARVTRKDQFTCASTQGCGGAGNHCRIDRLATDVGGEARRFTWGGGCALWDQGTRLQKLPDLAPDPFRERQALVAEVVAGLPARGGRRVVALADEFQLKGLLPFFATFLHRLGLDVAVAPGGDRAALKRGIEEANVPFCAPMQQYHGLVAGLAGGGHELVLVPLLRHLPRVAGERTSSVCPIVMGAPDVLRLDLPPEAAGRLLSPVIDMGPEGLESEPFERSCRGLAASVGVTDEATLQAALREGRTAQAAFDARLPALGQRALDWCREHAVTPVAVLGRSYTIHDEVLNSNVPAILRAQGAVGIPLDCLPVPADAPIFDDVFWSHSQRMLRAAWLVRRTPGLYGLFCSNYACGPDSFTGHQLAFLMEGKPFAVIETDGHAGDAGTRTRVEAFLHCVREDLRAARGGAPNDAARLDVARRTLGDLTARGERVLVPPMGPEAEALVAGLRGLGVAAEVLPRPTRETLGLGRRQTSGKECLPLTVTLGSLLERLQTAGSDGERYAFFMPGSDGPCRFGAYRQLQQLVLDRLGWRDRVAIWSPPLGDYFRGLPPGFAAIVYAGFCAYGALEEALHDVRPVEASPGAAEAIHAEAAARLSTLIEEATRGDLSAAAVLREAGGGRVWGIPRLVSEAAQALAAVKTARRVPVVLLAGEIYVRCDPFANGEVALALERRGLRVRLEPLTEFIQYTDWVAWKRGWKKGLLARLDRWLRDRILDRCHAAAAGPLGLPPPPPIDEAVAAAGDYLDHHVEVETLLTIGVPVLAWRRRQIDAVVSVGPLECMPNKLAEAQLHHAAEREGLLSLTLNLNGDPLDEAALDGFAFEVHRRFRASDVVGVEPCPPPPR